MTRENIKLVVDAYLRKITDETIRKKQSEDMPVVGLPKPLQDLLLSVDKGIFIFEAHTGGGKSTFGKMLYHLAKKGHIPYDVTYIDATMMKREENASSDDILIQKIEEVMVKPFENKDKDSVMTTATTNYGEGNQKFEDILRKIDESNKKYLIILDELDKAVDVLLVRERIAKWATAIRNYNNKIGKIPVRLLILLTKVLGFSESLLEKIEQEGRDVKAFTEYRNLRIDNNILLDYLNNLNDHFKSKNLRKNLIGDVIDEKSIKKLTELLSNIENGRYIFPILHDAIADSIEKFLSSYSKEIQDINGVIEALNDTANKPIIINAESYVDQAIVAVTNDRYYKISKNKKDAIKIWSEGVKELSTIVVNRISKIGKIGSYTPQIISMELNHFIYQTSSSSFLWLSLARVTRENTYEKTIKKISKVLIGKGKQVKRIVNVLLLKPERRPAALVDQKTIGGIEFRFKIHDLNNEEILALLGVTGKFNLDKSVSETIVNELANTLVKIL
jgi:ABC-type oligopeptide transport system ATPase subunit